MLGQILLYSNVNQRYMYICLLPLKPLPHLLFLCIHITYIDPTYFTFYLYKLFIQLISGCLGSLLLCGLSLVVLSGGYSSVVVVRPPIVEALGLGFGGCSI